ncbi:MogA/MoaB family molybdenum cofactor biosynthesis protein [Wansuia hejianensis]|uniref:MogA/MoaB family molybdenum cofactor biosynthesis protein n=1 Tax=Wansuia hejianensis TaxID=2763667 RepID=A0A926IMU4_9FIRM|nr:MogA/MoaB family molybdenum cofactor biosynthesis protein [Wansuia hejianensis]MBC8590986.1 MogA/MoaB family molybdenum cofactor biosynthesis protein [Wansuia hejianensis]
MFTVGIITASDKGYKGQREDISGKVIEDILLEKGYKISNRIIVPDEPKDLKDAIIHMADELKVDLILTTGGTGFSKRDITPEVTTELCDRMANGIAEAIRYYSLSITPRAMLSRGVSGIRKDTLIVNLPGSPKAVKEALEYSLDSIYHGLEILTNSTSDCARK